MNETATLNSKNLQVFNAPVGSETGAPAATVTTTTTTTTTFQSYLNNDGIDSLTPTPRKKRVSSLSLSDQWAANSIHGLTSLSRSGSMANRRSSSKLNKSFSSRLSMLSANSEAGTRYKKDKIDHPRVANYAFAFDIDGVIVKGPETVPCAKEALAMLDGQNPYNIKVPYIFVTNGGGRAESERATELTSRLGVEITENQVIQGHTPMKDLVDVYDNVLVVGGVGDKCRKVAEHYGFKNVFIPLDIMYWDPSVTPYYNLTEEDKKVCKKDVDFSKTKIDAILVFADSRNWAADQQIILELLMSKGGFMGTTSESFDEGPGIYFAHSDFIWATNYKLSRYGMGALQVSIAALFRESTGKELKVTRFGKPQRGTFKYAEKVLSKWRKGVLDEQLEELSSTMGSETEETEITSEEDDEGLTFASKAVKAKNVSVFKDSDSESDEEDEEEGLTIQKLTQLTLDLPPANTVYFVGDTPESDIRFANSHDESWYSILVKTGVYQEGTIPKYTPKHTCDNVLESVKFAIEREHQLELDEWNAGALETAPLAATQEI